MKDTQDPQPGQQNRTTRSLKITLSGLSILASCIVLSLLATSLLPGKPEPQTAPPPTGAVVAYTILPPTTPTPSPTAIVETSTSPPHTVGATAILAITTPEATPSSTHTPISSPQILASATPVVTIIVETAVVGDVISVITPTAIITPQLAPNPPPLATPDRIAAAVILEETLTLSTYAYEQALVTAPDFPYPVLDMDRLGPARPKPYRAVILENEALRLTFLPELGGRLYQITDKVAHQDVLYNNPVIKPTHWGPPEMNWWLAAGGMEWAFPVEEHGYAWAMPWFMTATSADDGSARATLTFQDRVTNLAAEVSIVLPATGRTFALTLTLANPGDEPATGQFWVNTALPAGPVMRVDLPATEVEVHSAGASEEVVAGQVLPWEAEMGEWGRWQTWFSAFAAPVTSGSVAMWGPDGRPGLRRTFNPETTPGLKLFIWGPEANTVEFEGHFYYEVWGGLTPDFDTFITLAPGDKRQWSEEWTILEGDNR